MIAGRDLSLIYLTLGRCGHRPLRIMLQPYLCVTIFFRTYKFFALYKYLLFLLRQKQILCADENKNNGENYSQRSVLKAVEQEKTERNADETVADVGQCRLFINQIVLYVKYNCQYCGGDKKYKVNSLRNRLRHILIKREVENKDSASAEAHCAENSGDCSGNNIKYHFISILIPA